MSGYFIHTLAPARAQVKAGVVKECAAALPSADLVPVWTQYYSAGNQRHNLGPGVKMGG